MSMGTITGLDRFEREEFRGLYGQTIGVLCNQASVTRSFVHLIDRLLPYHRSGALKIGSVIGPQHGLFGHTQDNMIEWEGHVDPRTGLTIHSLYGQRREPTREMLCGLDRLVIDIQDVGSRYYTFAWTMAHCLRACAAAGIPVTVLDRPNPIGGTQVEGPVLEEGFGSFVGLYPLPIRTGLTLGEVATYVQQRFVPSVDLDVVRLEGWSREEYQEETGVPWTIPSPNMPTVDTAVVYPGGCLIEGTNLSEGRGTTRPFEIVGAPFLDGWRMAEALNGEDLPGAVFRPMQFQPTFNKHVGRLCEGVFVHVTDRRTFEPVLAYVAIIQAAIAQTGVHWVAEDVAQDERFVATAVECDLDGFAWKRPPYEYEALKMPIDILAGNEWLRGECEKLTPLSELRERFRASCVGFEPTRRAALLYP